MESPQDRGVAVARLLILAAILLVLGSIKLFYRIGNGPFGLDAANYLQIARNVEEGHGLTTNVSLYYSGLKHLPARSSNIYPVWPLLLGYAGRYLGLFRAADWLSKIFYLLDVALIYFLANRLMLRIAGREAIVASTPELTTGHLFAIFFGANLQFFVSTTYPYTEGLAFFFAFAALLCMDHIETSTSFVWPVAAGVVAGLALLTRTQMVILCLALPAALIWILFREPRLWTRAVALLAGLMPPAAYWYFDVLRRPDDRIDIDSFQIWVAPPSVMQSIRERLDGLLTGFDPGSTLSYVHLLGFAALIPLIALPLFLYDRRGRSWRDVVSPPVSMLLVTASVISGLGFFVSLNLYHSTFFLPWLFGYRHGLPYIFLLIPAASYLLSTNRAWARWIVLLAIALSVVRGATGIIGFVTDPRPEALTPAEQELVRWLDTQHPPPVIFTTHAQDLSIQTRAMVHWAYCGETPRKTVLMLEKLPIDYVIVYEAERECPYLRGLGGWLRVDRSFGTAPNRIFILVRGPAFSARSAGAAPASLPRP